LSTITRATAQRDKVLAGLGLSPVAEKDALDDLYSAMPAEPEPAAAESMDETE